MQICLNCRLFIQIDSIKISCILHSKRHCDLRDFEICIFTELVLQSKPEPALLSSFLFTSFVVSLAHKQILKSVELLTNAAGIIFLLHVLSIFRVLSKTAIIIFFNK